MSRYSSDSETSVSSKKKKSSKATSSKRSSSRSASPKRRICKKKLKKYKSRDRSYSRERKERSFSRERRDRRSSERSKKYWHSSNSPGHRKRSRSRSASRSREKKRYDRSNSRSRRDRRSRDKGRHRRKSSSRSSRSSSSSSTSSSSSYRRSKKSTKPSSRSKSPNRQKKLEYDADDLLMKLNKAAIEAMAANKKLTEPSNVVEMQIKREEMINRIEADGFSAQPFMSASVENENSPTVVDLTAPTLHSKSIQLEPSDSYLHPNFLLENQEEKFIRWIKKLYTFRQRAINGDLVMV